MSPAPAVVETRPVMSARVTWLASIVFCGVLPALTLVVLFAVALDSVPGMDFRQFYRGAEAILDGESPYPAADASLIASARSYIYPPFPALLAIPFTVLSIDTAGLVVMIANVAVALAIPYVLGVRDWRCYGIVLLWPPVISAIQTSNPTLLLTLAAALVWRFRDRPLASSASLGVTLATKFVFWPLVAWMAATRRYASAALTCVVGAALLVLSWAAIGFAGFREYPDLLRRLEDTVGGDAYTVHILALDLGAPTSVARAVWLGLGIGLLAAVVVVGRRGDDRSSFILAIAAAIAVSPLVWLHYFTFLLVAVAIARPRLGLPWCVPLAMFVATGTGNPTLFETVVTLAAAAVTIALVLRAPPEATSVRSGLEAAPAHAAAHET